MKDGSGSVVPGKRSHDLSGIFSRGRFPRILLIVLFLILIGPMTLSVCSTARAAAFRIMDQSASATGQSAAFVAQADDASAIYYNPAGMTQIPRLQISLGTMLAGGSTSFRSPQGATTSGNFGGSIASPPPSNFYVTANLKDLGLETLGDTTVGLALLSPFGIKYQYPEDAPFATATFGTTLEIIDIKPTLAYRLNEHLSFGLGADIYTFFNFWGEGQGETHIISSGAPGLPPAGSRMEINGKDTALGFNVSLLYTPFRNPAGKPLANIGLIYRSQATLQLDGQFLSEGTVLADTSTTLVLPQVITGGMALWPIRDNSHEWKVEFDTDYTGWKSFRNLDVHLSTGATIPYPQDWQSTFTIMIGTEYKWLQPAMLVNWEVAARGGYWFSQSPMPDKFYNPTFPADADNHALSIGLGLLCKAGGKLLGVIPCGKSDNDHFWARSMALDLAFKALLYEDRTVTGATNPIAIPGVLDGTYETTFYIGAINLLVNF